MAAAPAPGVAARRDLRFLRLLGVWWPLAVTFLLVTGGTPIINASINRLPGRDHKTDLAAFAVFLQCVIVLHSPLFVIRELAIKLSADRASARRALGFCMSVAGVISAVELLLGLTPLGGLLLGFFSDDAALAARGHAAFLVIWPAPLFIALRGVYQAHQIRDDDTLLVGLGTLVRLVSTGVLGLLLAPHWGLDGPGLGAVCMVLGIALESAFALVRGRRNPLPEHSDLRPPHPLRFGLPLMFANTLGVAAGLFYVKIAGEVALDLRAASVAGFHEAKSLHFMLGAGTVALQSLTTAKVRTAADARPMLRFGLVVGAVLSAVFAAIAFVPALRLWVLVDALGERPDGQVLGFAVPALALASAMPLLGALRFGLRGVLISRGHTRAITISTVSTLLILLAVLQLGLSPFPRNGALSAYALWVATQLLEIAILLRAARSPTASPPILPPPLRSPRESSAG